MTQPSDICQTCGKSRAWHEANNPIHPFNSGQAGATAFLGKRRDRDPQTGRKTAQQGAETPPRVVWPNDPVLRVALINAGVISPEQLAAAENQLRAALGDVLGGAPWSAQEEGSTGSSTETGKTSTAP